MENNKKSSSQIEAKRKDRIQELIHTNFKDSEMMATFSYQKALQEQEETSRK